MKLEYSLVIVFAVAIIVSLLIVYFANKENKKELKERLQETRLDWASALDARDKLHNREVELLDRYIASLQDLLVEKDERIKQLESDIALKDFVMSCAKVDGSFDERKLKDMFEHIEVRPSV